MTVIQPNKNQNLLPLVFILGTALLVLAAVYIFFYAELTSLTHDIEKVKKELEGLRVQNAELKNDFYSVLDSGRLEELAKEKGFIYDKNPRWEFASQW